MFVYTPCNVVQVGGCNGIAVSVCLSFCVSGFCPFWFGLRSGHGGWGGSMFQWGFPVAWVCFMMFSSGQKTENCCVCLSHLCSAFITAVCLEGRQFRGEPLWYFRVVAFCTLLFSNPSKCLLKQWGRACFLCDPLLVPGQRFILLSSLLSLPVLSVIY